MNTKEKQLQHRWLNEELCPELVALVSDVLHQIDYPVENFDTLESEDAMVTKCKFKLIRSVQLRSQSMKL